MARWIEQVGRCRALVASLGESAGWWRCQAMGSVGNRFLARLYPRTAHLAAIETPSLAARAGHDESILSHGHFHLFRLPTGDEAIIRAWFESEPGIALLRSITEMSQEQRLADLKVLAKGERAPATNGPIHCGTLNAIRQGQAVERMAAAYASAFSNAARVYPYLEDPTA